MGPSSWPLIRPLPQAKPDFPKSTGTGEPAACHPSPSSIESLELTVHAVPRWRNADDQLPDRGTDAILCARKKGEREGLEEAVGACARRELRELPLLASQTSKCLARPGFSRQKPRFLLARRQPARIALTPDRISRCSDQSIERVADRRRTEVARAVPTNGISAVFRG